MSLAKCLLHGLLLLATGQLANPPSLVEGSQIRDAPEKLSKWGKPIAKGDYDDRDYNHVTMLNGQECLLIFDPRATRSDILVFVNAGVSHQVDDLPVAQLLPHLLFKAQGPEGPGALSLGAGLELQVSVNMDSTVLHFVSEISLFKDLARVAGGLAQTLGTPRKDDVSLALKQMASHLAVGSPQHQIRMAEDVDFAYGEAGVPREKQKGLGERARAFFEQFYVSSHIRIIINTSYRRLDQLQKQLRPFFKIRMEGVPRPDWSYRKVPPFKTLQLVEIAILEGLPRLDVLWEIPIADRGDVNFLTKVLIRPGPQGLANHLRSRGLARFVTCRMEGFSASQDVLRISVYLAPKQRPDDWQEVFRLLLRYLNDLAEASPREEAYMWAQSADRHSFDYRGEYFDPLALRDQLLAFARTMLHPSVAKDQILSSSLYSQRFDANRLWDSLRLLTPERCRVTIFRSSLRKSSTMDLLAPPPVTLLARADLDANKILKEPPGSAECPLPIEIASPRPSMGGGGGGRTAGPSRYIVGPEQTDSDVCMDEYNSNIYRWLRHDASYKIPSIVFRFLWSTLRPSSTIENVSATHLVALMLQRVLVDVVEEAHSAHVLINTYATREGIVFSFVGRIELIEVFLAPLLEAVLQFVDKLLPLFYQCQKEYAMQLKSQPPGEAMDDWFNRIVDPRHYNVQQLRETIRRLTQEQCAAMFTPWLERAPLRILFFGDLGDPNSPTREAIKTKIMPLLRDTFATSNREQQPSPRDPVPSDLDAPKEEVILGQPRVIVTPLLEGNQGAIKYFAEVASCLIALTHLYVHLFQADFLRMAVERLGGGAQATMTFRRSPPPTGILFGVSVEGCDPESLESFIREFIQWSIGKLEACGEQGDFSIVRDAVIAELSRKPSWLVEAADATWSSIENHQVDGTIGGVTVNALKKITLAKMVEQVRSFMLPEGEFSQITILHGWGTVHRDQRAKRHPNLPESHSGVVKWKRKKKGNPGKRILRRLSGITL